MMRSETPVPLVGIIDDDKSVRDSINSLLRSVGYRTVVFPSADAFLHSEYMDHASQRMILLVDLRMPGLNGLELQRLVAGLNYPIPIIFVTADEDHTNRARALQQGAFAFFVKPFSANAILVAISSALEARMQRR
jgi:FixJ family two-component response regulator